MRLGDRAIDVGLSALDAECNAIYVCSQEPVDFTTAITTYALGNKSGAPGDMFGSPSDAAGGRQVASVAFTGGTITASSTATWWAAVDTVNLRFLASGPISNPITLQMGQTFGLSSFSVELSGPFKVSALLVAPLLVSPESIGTPAIVFEKLLNSAALLISSPTLGTPSVPSLYSDGSSGAPAGTAIQFPTLLSAITPPLATRPAWRVAGVDYPVGIPAAIVLKNPNTMVLTGVIVDTNGHHVTVTGNGVTIDGWDFSLNGGWDVTIGANNCTIQNCNFVSSSLNAFIIASGAPVNCLIQYNIIDNANGNSGMVANYSPCQLIRWWASGTSSLTVQYNWLRRAGVDMLSLGGAVGTTYSATIRYNVFEDGGQAGPHADWLQTGNATGSLIVQYNTGISANRGYGGTQGWMFEQTVAPIFPNIDFGWNTGVQIAPVQTVNYYTALDPNCCLAGSTQNIHDNYVFLGYAGQQVFGFMRPANQDESGGPLTSYNTNGASTTINNNIDMSTGALATPNVVPVGSGAPVPTGATFTLSNPTTDELIGNITFTGGTPTAWSITSGNSSGYFAIYLQANGTANLRTSTTIVPSAGTFTLTVQATNSSGSNTATVSVTITTAANPPVVTNGTFSFNTVGLVAGATVGQMVATNSPTSWAITAGDSTDFAINSSGLITVTTAGAANLVGLAGTISPALTIQATNAFGSGTGTATISYTNIANWWGDDGSANAPTGTPQFPNLFTSQSAVAGITNPNAPYAVRPPWKVAGVDYRVGINTGVVLKNISTITAAAAGPNFFLDSAHLQIWDSNVVLDGWDFTNGNNGTGPCVGIDTRGGTNLTVRNCKFSVGTNGNHVFSQAGNPGTVLFEYNEVNCLNHNDDIQDQYIYMSVNGAMTIRYSFFQQSGGDAFDTGQNTAIKYNLILSSAMQGGHSDWVQMTGTQPSSPISLLVDFNTWIQNNGAGTQGIGFIDATSGQNLGPSTLLEASYNTMITYTSMAQPNYLVLMILSGTGTAVSSGTTVNCQYNYADPSGTIANGANGKGLKSTGSLPGGATLNYGGNYDMRSGTLIAINS